ncbi:dephospho-CoA kinase [Candidatus Pelagibacter bacterium]|nr:dephospho-CoA kinase [Candidatus Pelagibacter bacterium]
MIKIGITGSIASGKTTASKILSHKRGPLFSADKVVKKFYSNENFIKLLIREFNFKRKSNLRKLLKDRILKDKKNIKRLEKIIHPMVRREMKKFSNRHKKKNKTFYEIPLLIENKLMKFFNVIILIKAKKKTRLRRFQVKGGSKKLFAFLNNKQLSEQKKTKFSNHVVVNEKNLAILKKNLLSIINLYV